MCSDVSVWVSYCWLKGWLEKATETYLKKPVPLRVKYWFTKDKGKFKNSGIYTVLA